MAFYYDFDEVLDAKSGIIYAIYKMNNCLDYDALLRASWGPRTDEDDHRFFNAELRRLTIDFNMRERILIPYIVNLVREDCLDIFRSLLRFIAHRADYEMRINLWIVIMEKLEKEGDNAVWPEITDFLRANSGFVLQMEPAEPMPEKYEYTPAILEW